MDRGYGDYLESHGSMNSATSSSWSSDYHVSRQFVEFDNNHGSGNAHYPHHHHHHNFSSSTPPPIDSAGTGLEVGFGDNSAFVSGRKRPFCHPVQEALPDYTDGGSFVKLYVAGIPRTATEQDIRSLFGEHGNIVEVVLLKDKRTGQQLESCFVKYSKLAEADLAIEVLNNQHIFPGTTLPLKVRYADTGKGRLGLNTKQPICQVKPTYSIGSSIKEMSLQDIRGGVCTQISKLYVAGLDKQASKKEIEEMFSTYGFVEEVFMLYDELKQSRGRAFVQFSHRDMAVSAISALNGTYTMRGCDQPLIVRFADPKKPKVGEPRGNYQFGGSGYNSSSQESFFRPPPPTTVIDPIGRHPSSRSDNPQQSGSEPPIVSSSRTALESSTTISRGPAVPPPISGEQEADCQDCDWSEHVCPEGYTYYYNCLTCESKWEKPEEYTVYEQRLRKLQQWRNPPHQQFHSSSHPQEFDRGRMQGETSPVLASPCC